MSQSLKFFNKEYANYWLKQRSIVGLSPYDEALLEFIKPLQGKILEVAIGTGKPFATLLATRLFAGCDISLPLLKEAKRQIGSKLVQSSAENLPFADKSFDAIYCFHSTWFFHDLERFMLECKRTLKPNGTLIFDIMNAKNIFINKEYKKNLRQNTIPFFILLKYARNIIKVLLRVGTPIWQNIVPWRPVKAETVSALSQGLFKIKLYGYLKDKTFTSIADEETSFQKILVKAVSN